jgi:hypothetical protein
MTLMLSITMVTKRPTTFKELCILPEQCIYAFHTILGLTVTIALNTITKSVFVMQVQPVLCEVRMNSYTLFRLFIFTSYFKM